MRYLLRRRVPFTAVASANDGIAAGAMRVARESGHDVPGDISIVGFDNLVIARYLYPRLSTTPNHKAVGAKLAAAEGADEALVTASGSSCMLPCALRK